MATPGSEPQPFVPALSVAPLHPHHHPHHHHHHQQQQLHGGTGASGGPGGGGGGGGSGGFNLPLNRGLERALEEAANSGGLNLSARKLKEFPRTAAPAHDLSDTVQAGPHPWHMEVPRLAYTTAAAMWDPSPIFNLHHSSWQRWILNPLSEARDRTCILIDTTQIDTSSFWLNHDRNSAKDILEEESEENRVLEHNYRFLRESV